MAMTQKSSADPRLAHNEEQVAELARPGDQLRADKVKKDQRTDRGGSIPGRFERSRQEHRPPMAHHVPPFPLIPI
jgi:hypothetical protein